MLHFYTATRFSSSPPFTSYLVRRPIAYLGALCQTLVSTWESANFFFGSIGIFPKVVGFAAKMERMNVDHIHAHFANHPATAAYVIHRLTGIPFSFTAHGADIHVESRMLREKVERAAFVVAVSEFNRKFILRKCGLTICDKIVVNHCGIDMSLFPKRATPNRSGVFRVLMVASLEEVKGHYYLVEAGRLLEEAGLDWECWLVGEGPMRRRIEGWIAEAGLRHRMILMGGQPRPRVLELLSRADVVVLPSVQTRKGKREGIQVALMEAMAVGLPVVSSRLSGIPELVKDGRTGFLTEPRDSKGLAGVLKRLAEDRELRTRMGLEGRRTVASRFDLTANTTRLLQFILGSVGSSRRQLTPDLEHLGAAQLR